jgi:hypothetical protein
VWRAPIGAGRGLGWGTAGASTSVVAVSIQRVDTNVTRSLGSLSRQSREKMRVVSVGVVVLDSDDCRTWLLVRRAGSKAWEQERRRPTWPAGLLDYLGCAQVGAVVAGGRAGAVPEPVVVEPSRGIVCTVGP